VARDGHYIAVVGAGACEPEVGIDTWELSRQGRRAEAIARAAGPEEAVALVAAKE
jgi:hypothetical protein